MFKKVIQRLLVSVLTLIFMAGLLPGMDLYFNARAASVPSGNWSDLVAGSDLSYSSATTAYTIDSEEDLAWVAYQVNNGITTFAGCTLNVTTEIDLSTHFWTPIGNSSSYYFSGTFNGNDYKISGLTIGTSNSPIALDYAGLFGYATSVTIKNVNIVNISIYSSKSSCIGGIVGYTTGGSKIENCTVTGYIGSGEINILGGICGRFYDTGALGGVIRNCSSSCILQGYCYTGGIAGFTRYITIINSYSTGSAGGRYIDDVTGSTGGIVGMGESITVSNCFSRCNVVGTSRYAGGLSAYTYSSVYTNNYSTGSVQRDKGGLVVGGFFGAQWSNTISNCYWEKSDGISSSGSKYAADIKAMTQVEMQSNSFNSLLNTNADAITGALDWKIVTGKNGGFPQISGVGGYVSAYTPMALNVTVSGYTTVGQTLSASYDYCDMFNNAESGTTFQWYRASDSSGTGIAKIDGATDSTYILASTDLDKYLRVEVTPSNGTISGASVKSDYSDVIKESIFAGGSGKSGDPYIITNLIQLKAVADCPSAYFQLGNNITDNLTSPICSNTNPFTGHMDGNGCSVSVDISDPSNAYVGLFGYIGSGGYVGDLNVAGTVTKNAATAYVGGLAGYNAGNIEKCASNIDVTANGSTAYYVGGLIGYNVGTIAYSFAGGNVIGGPTTGIAHVGGLVGCNYSVSANVGGTWKITTKASLDHCYALGAVTSNASTPAKSNVGGLVGANLTPSTSSLAATDYNIQYCFAKGNVTGASGYTGGLIGANMVASITNNFASGNLSVTKNSIAGGLVGYNRSGAYIDNCYATGAIINNSSSGLYYGGLVGYMYSGTIGYCYAAGAVSTANGNAGGFIGNFKDGTITNCCWNSSKNTLAAGNKSSSTTADTTYGTGLKTMQMVGIDASSNMSGLDFTTFFATKANDIDYWYFPQLKGFSDSSNPTIQAASLASATITAPDITAPAVTGLTPSGTGTSISGNIAITFSEAMDTTVTGAVYLNGSISLTGGNWSVNVLTYTVAYSGLSYGTAYTIAISACKDAAGNEMTADSSHNFTTADAPDTGAPAVTGVTPGGTGTSISGNIAITFSEAMDTTVTGVVYLNGSISLTGGNWSANALAYTVAYSGLSYSTAYTIAISAFKDAAGNEMTADSSHNFTTAGVPDTGAPAVTGVTPSGTGTSISGNIAITFGEAMDTTVTGAVSLNGGTTLTGGNWSADALTYTVAYSGLSYSTAYAIAISAFKDAAGNEMTADSSHNFTTAGALDTTAPAVTGVTPGGTGTSISGNIAITFGEAMDTTVTGAVYLNGSISLTGGNWSANALTYTVAYSGLSYSTAYTIAISAFKDAAGNEMTADSSHNFTTAGAPDTAAPAITGVTPGGTGTSISGNIAITFGEAMDTTVAGAVYLSDDGGANYGSALTGGSWSVGNTVYTIGYSGLDHNTVYTVRIKDFADLAGNKMDDDVSHSFKTQTASQPITSATISPVTVNFDKYSPGDVETTITWNDAGSVTDIKAGGKSIGAGSYTVNGNSLTITEDYLAMQSIGNLELMIAFDTGDAVKLTVNIVNNYIPGKTLISIITPSAITGIANSTAKSAEALGLPSTVTLITSAGNVSASVTWDVASCSYNESSSSALTFTVNGTVTLPSGVINPNSVSLITSISVSVNSAFSGSSGSSGSSGNRGSTPVVTYSADVKGIDTEGNVIQRTTSLVTVDANTSNAAIYIGSQQGNIIASGGTAFITVPSIPEIAAYTMSIPYACLSRLDGKGTLTFNTNKGNITLHADMLAGMSGVEGKDAKITIGQGDKFNLPEATQALIGDRPLIQLSVSIDGEQIEWNNPNSPVTISIPYMPTAAELANPESIIIWYIDGSGNAVSIPNGHYDSVTGQVTFATTHFSYYAVGYNKVSFTDVAASAWYSKAVSFIAARGITTGTGNGSYNPEAKLTRGEFLVMMMRVYGVSPDVNTEDNFSDAGNTYYTGYLAAAKKLGISGGIGNNLYAPNNEINRQEMCTLLYNALKVVGGLPEGNSEKQVSTFDDAEQIKAWAKDSMTLFVKTGIISGSGSKLLPAKTTTRAEMAQILYNLMLK